MLARESPRLARANVDNYAYFALVAFFSVRDGARWNTDSAAVRDDELR